MDKDKEMESLKDQIRKIVESGDAGDTHDESINFIKELCKCQEKEQIDLKCENCQQNLYRKYNLFCGPVGGVYFCKNCNFSSSGYAFWGRRLIEVEPLPQAASLIYFEEPVCDDIVNICNQDPDDKDKV